MTAKVCPRCGCQYENFKSTTCPQCFAILVAVDEQTAEALSAARAEVERSPEFQETKLADDERFRQQSFGACLGIAALTLVTLIVAVVLLVSAAHHRAAHPASIAVATASVKEEPLTTLPVAAATPAEVLPPDVGPFSRQAADANTVLTGTLTPLFHAVYTGRPPAPVPGSRIEGSQTEKTQSAAAGEGAASSAPTSVPFRLPRIGAGGHLLDVYALPAGRPTAEQNEFRLGLTVASQIGGAPRPTLFFATEYWHFAVLASPSDSQTPTQFRDALAAHFGYTGVSTSKGSIP